ncbi:TBP interacting domain protein [Aspergillus flavus AF70]|nr:TBP interacting domain protein [Aspergillus flavus AF70]
MSLLLFFDSLVANLEEQSSLFSAIGSICSKGLARATSKSKNRRKSIRLVNPACMCHRGRVGGRQAVYHALQKGADESTLERMVVLDDHILQLQEQLTDLKGYVKRARAELATLRATPLAFDLQKSINQLQVKKETTFAILTQARGTSAREVDEEGRTITKRVWERWQKRVNLRRKVCRDLWRRCLEMVDKDVTREELWGQAKILMGLHHLSSVPFPVYGV